MSLMRDETGRLSIKTVLTAESLMNKTLRHAVKRKRKGTTWLPTAVAEPLL